jgi:hypothetical protein
MVRALVVAQLRQPAGRLGSATHPLWLVVAVVVSALELAEVAVVRWAAARAATSAQSSPSRRSPSQAPRPAALGRGPAIWKGFFYLLSLFCRMHL